MIIEVYINEQLNKFIVDDNILMHESISILRSQIKKDYKQKKQKCKLWFTNIIKNK